MPPYPPEEPYTGSQDEDTVLPSPTPSSGTRVSAAAPTITHRHGPFRDQDAASRNSSQISNQSYHSDGQASRKSIASDFKGFQPPSAPKARDSVANRESYISSFSDYSGRIDNVDDMGAQPTIVKLVADQSSAKSVPHTQVAVDMSDLTSEASSVNFGKLPTIVTTPSKGQVDSKVSPDYSYDTNIEAAVPRRSPRRPKSEIISTNQTKALNEALGGGKKKSKHKKHTSVALSDDLDDLMKTASNLESLETDDFFTDAAPSPTHEPQNAIAEEQENSRATISPEDSVITIQKPRDNKTLPPRPSFEHLQRAREVSNARHEKDLYESGIKDPKNAPVKSYEHVPVEGSSGATFGQTDPISGYILGVDPYSAPGAQQDFSYKGLTFSEDSIIQKNAAPQNIKEQVQYSDESAPPPRAQYQERAMADETGVAGSSLLPLQAQTRLSEPESVLETSSNPSKLSVSSRNSKSSDVPISSEVASDAPNESDVPVASKHSNRSHVSHPSQDITFQQHVTPGPQAASSTHERHNSGSSFYPDSRKYSATSSYHVKNITEPATVGVDPKTPNDDDEYYDIGDPILVHNPTRIKSVKESTTRLPAHKRTKSKSKKIRNARASRELKPFSYSTLISLLESMNGTIIGEEFSHLNLPVKEKQLIEKIVDSLSRLTSDMVIDEHRYEVGIQRLEKALRVLEGFM